MNHKIVLAGLNLEAVDYENTFEETKQLAIACGFEIVGEVVQKRRSPHPATYFGEGKVEAIKECIIEKHADVCMIAENLTPSQMRTLQEMLGVKVLDRNDCILEIFAQRAHTKQARLQVQLATLKHQLPYVIHTEQNFSRMRGGRNKGEGEKQYQLNQRKLEVQIQRVEKELKEVKNSLETMKKKRKQSSLKMISLVGYTNAGKSTFMNQILKLCDADEAKHVFVKDMLFATLDTSVRLISYQGIEFLLSDTVGFVSNLPHELVDAFHSTLSEVVDADLILQIVDESSNQKTSQMQVTQDTLKKLQVEDTEMWIIHNKCDLCEFKKSTLDHFYISASNNQYVSEVLDAIIDWIQKGKVRETLEVAYDNSQVISMIHKYTRILSVKEKEDSMEFYVEMEKNIQEKFVDYVKIEENL